MPKISLVAPVYGVEQYIEQFLESIRCQTFSDFEVILVDDGSPDECPRILDTFAEEDRRYHVIHQTNAGVSAARNAGLTLAVGEYIYVVDSDDWLEPTALESLAEEAERSHADLIYGDYVAEQSHGSIRNHCFAHEFFTEDLGTIHALQFAVNANGKKIKISRPEFDTIDHFGGAPWRCMVKSGIIKEHDLQYDTTVRGLGDDILFTLHLYEYVTSVSYIPHVIYHYRSLDDSYSHGYKADYLEYVKRIFDKQEDFLNAFHKDELVWQSYYFRVYLYLQQGMQRYFLNTNNPKTVKESRQEFLRLMRTKPYHAAMSNLPIRLIGGRRLKIYACFLKFGFNRVYWQCVRIFHK